ncbi:HAD family hydrolase [bacterium]|nr:HAD family hydrolase [bacterium]
MTLEPYQQSSEAITQNNKHCTTQEVFTLIQQKVRDDNDSNTSQVIVFDLDATLFDNRPRILKILEDALNVPGKEFPQDIYQIISNIQPAKMKYRVKDTLLDHGIKDKALLDYFFQFWWDHFFSDDYVMHDIPNPGAVEFSNKCKNLGTTIIYLTGRDTPNMRKGTLASLKKHGFPIVDDSSVYLITKPAFELSDAEFKHSAIDQIIKTGTVIATFDNEPEMNNLQTVSFPDAIHVFLDTMHSPNIVPLHPEIVVLKDFQF